MFFRNEIDVSMVLVLIFNLFRKILGVYLPYFAASIRLILQIFFSAFSVTLCIVFLRNTNEKRSIPGAAARTVREWSAFFRLFTALRSGDRDQQPLCLRQTGKLLFQLVCRKDLRRGYMEPPGHCKHLLSGLRVVDTQGDFGVGIGQRVTKGDATDDRVGGTA